MKVRTRVRFSISWVLQSLKAIIHFQEFTDNLIDRAENSDLIPIIMESKSMKLHPHEHLNFKTNLLLGLHTMQGKTKLVKFVAQSLGVTHSFKSPEEAMKAIFKIRPDLDGLRGIRDLAVSLGYAPQ